MHTLVYRLNSTLLSLFALTLSVNLLSPAVLANNGNCSNISVIFLRGSGQNRDSRGLNNTLDYDLFGQFEEQSYAFFQNINDKTKSINKDITKEFVSFHNQGGHKYGYKALGAESFAKKATHNTATTIRSNAYYESVYDGSDALTQYLKAKMVNCPDQKIVIGGYSQGAQVVGESLPRLTGYERSKIIYAAIYGDPKFNFKDGTSLYKKGSWVRGSAMAFSTGVLGARLDYLPSDMRGKSGSWCDAKDPICTGRNSNEPIGRFLIDKYLDPIHSKEYQNRWIPQSMNEIMGAVGDSDIFNKNPPQAKQSTFYRKNGTRPLTDIVLVVDTAGSNVKGIDQLRENAGSISRSLLKDKNTQVAIVQYSNQTPGMFGSTPTYGWENSYGPTKVQWELERNLKSLHADNPNGAWIYTPMYAGLNVANNVMERIGRQGAQKQYIVYTNKYPGGVFADGVKLYTRNGVVFVTKEQIMRKMYTLDPVVANAIVVPDASVNNNDAESYINNYVAKTGGGVLSTDLNNIANSFDEVANEFDTSPVAVISEPIQDGRNLLVSGGESYDPNSYITKYRWDCNDDGFYEIEDSQPAAVCEYSTNYSGIIGLEVESADGQKAKMYKTVNVLAHNQNMLVEDLVIEQQKLNEENIELKLVNAPMSSFVFAVYDDEGNIIDNTNLPTIAVDINSVPTDYIVCKLFINGQETASKRLQIKNFPAPEPLPPSIANDSNTNNNQQNNGENNSSSSNENNGSGSSDVTDPTKENPITIDLSEEDYLKNKLLNDISEKNLTLPNDSLADKKLSLVNQSASISLVANADVDNSNLAVNSGAQPNNETNSYNNETSGTVLNSSASNEPAKTQLPAEKSEVLGESVIKKSNIPGFLIFLLGFISLVGLLLITIKKANNKLDSF